jgi:hypothetical protein
MSDMAVFHADVQCEIGAACRRWRPPPATDGSNEACATTSIGVCGSEHGWLWHLRQSMGMDAIPAAP